MIVSVIGFDDLKVKRTIAARRRADVLSGRTETPNGHGYERSEQHITMNKLVRVRVVRLTSALTSGRQSALQGGGRLVQRMSD
jgi:hypothetical protein